MREQETYRVEITEAPSDYFKYRVYVRDSQGAFVDWAFADTKWGARLKARRIIAAHKRNIQGILTVASYEVRA